jgi:membrane protein implicated in regulation of membrane protease activity
MALVLGLIAFIVLDSPLGIVALLAGVVIEVGELYAWTRFLRRYRVQTGPEGLVGMRGEVLDACVPEGRARVRGELWRVRCTEGTAERGEEIVVTAVDGLTLEVEPTGAQLR